MVVVTVHGIRSQIAGVKMAELLDFLDLNNFDRNNVIFEIVKSGIICQRDNIIEAYATILHDVVDGSQVELAKLLRTRFRLVYVLYGGMMPGE